MFQCDNGTEYSNSSFWDFFRTNGIHLHFSYPYTSQLNGKAERLNRTIGNMIRALLIQASMPPSFWAEALLTTSHILNLLHSSLLNYTTPYETLYHKQPSYNHLRVFGCACYPNLLSQAPYKLSPRSTLCVFLGYPHIIKDTCVMIYILAKLLCPVMWFLMETIFH